MKNSQTKEILQLALDAGILQLSTGAEVWRVESTIKHICTAYGMNDVEFFVLSNAIFITGNNENEDVYAKVKYIPLAGVHMKKIAAVNDLSRAISSGKYTVEEARAQLEEIKELPANNMYLRGISAGIGSLAFVYIIGATLMESIMAGFVGAAVYLFSRVVDKQKISKLVKNLLGGGIDALLAFLIVQIPLFHHLDIGMIIIGAIMPLVPGVAFVNSIRDVANTDFLSGTIRMLDTIMVFIYLAVGAIFVLMVCNAFVGGNLWI